MLYVVVWFGFWILRYRVCNIDVCFMLDGAGGWRGMFFVLVMLYGVVCFKF